jgi:transcriptional regulator of acetoin/glycerol metabolism
MIGPHDLPADLFSPPPAVCLPGEVSGRSLDEIKRERLRKALEEAGGNQSEAARILGISRTSVWTQMKKYGLSARR